MLLGEEGSDEPDQGGAVGEDPDDIGPPPGLLLRRSFNRPSRVVQSQTGDLESAVEPVEVIGQGVCHSVEASGFVGPAAVAGVGFECLDVGALRLERVAEIGSGDEVVAGLADVGVGDSAITGASPPVLRSSSMPGSRGCRRTGRSGAGASPPQAADCARR